VLTDWLHSALNNLNLSQRDAAFTRVDELLSENSKYNEKSAATTTEVMTGVLQVYAKMDSLL